MIRPDVVLFRRHAPTVFRRGHRARSPPASSGYRFEPPGVTGEFPPLVHAASWHHQPHPDPLRLEGPIRYP